MTFPTDDQVLRMLEMALDPNADPNAFAGLLRFLTEMAGKPDDYQFNDVILALITEVRRLRAIVSPPWKDPE